LARTGSRPAWEVVISRLRRISHGLAGLTGLTGPADPAPRAASRRLRTVLPHVRLPRTVQPCIHCRQNPAGFWVTRKNSGVVRRPWCLACLQDLDLSSCGVTPFAG